MLKINNEYYFFTVYAYCKEEVLTIETIL